MTDEQQYMLRALNIAMYGDFTTAPNPNVGCVIVRDTQIVGEGWHQCAGEPHAEIYALRMAGYKARGATVYVTLEPCTHYGLTPPCCDALIAAGVKRVIVSMKDPNPQISGRGLYRLKQAGIDVNHGLMIKEAEAINRSFIKRMRTGFPFVQLKLAASLDGKIAAFNGESKWITSNEARYDVQILRAKSSAILSTSSTVLADNPSLTVRWSSLKNDTNLIFSKIKLLRQPLRIIIDSKNRITKEHNIINQPGKTLLLRKNLDHKVWPNNVKQMIVPIKNNYLDLVSILSLLGSNYQINSILVESGASLAGALLEIGLIDEMIIYIAPKLLGDRGYDLCKFTKLFKLANAPTFIFKNICQIGNDLRLTLAPKKSIQ